MGQPNEDPKGNDLVAALDEAIASAEKKVGQKSVAENASPAESKRCDRTIINAVESNADLLQQLLTQFEGLYEMVHQSRSSGGGTGDVSDDDIQFRLAQARIAELEEQVEELQQQNEDLASQVASTNVQEAVAKTSSGSSDALSWDQRKRLILEQMEDDSFDAESFVAALREESDDEDDEEYDDIENPAEFVQHMLNELERCNNELAKKDEEIHEYRALVQAQSETREGGLAIGAAAIAEIVDADELIQQERERLQMLQAEWEEKFREGEINASLERAKLSRERQAVARKQAALDEELERVKREQSVIAASGDAGGAQSRRWMVKLGLNGKEEETEK